MDVLHLHPFPAESKSNLVFQSLPKSKVMPIKCQRIAYLNHYLPDISNLDRLPLRELLMASPAQGL